MLSSSRILVIATEPVPDKELNSTKPDTSRLVAVNEEEKAPVVPDKPPVSVPPDKGK